MRLTADVGPTIYWKRSDKDESLYNDRLQQLIVKTQKMRSTISWNTSVGFDLKVYRGIRLQYAYAFGLSDITDDIVYQNKEYDVETFANNSMLAICYEMVFKRRK